MNHKRELSNRFRPIWKAEPSIDLAERCEDLLRRMHVIWHKTQQAVYLFADDEGYVYLVATENPRADHVRLEEHRFFVGCYSRVFPTAGQLREDLIAHFCGLDYITEKMIRDAICDAEG